MNQHETTISPMQRYKSYSHLLSITINICLTGFFFGYVTGYFNSIRFEDIVRIYEIGDTSLSAVQGVLTGIISLTGGVGAYFTSHLLLKFSRKECLQIISISAIIISILTMIPSLTILFIARSLQGLLIGIASVVTPLYIREFSPIELAGSLCPYYAIGYVFGLTFSFALTFMCSLFLPVEFYWRIIFGFPILTSIYQLYKIKYYYPYETPKYLLLQGKEQEVRDLLAVIYKEDFVEEVLKDLKKALMNFNNRVSRMSKMTEEDLPNLEIVSLKPNLAELEKRLTEIEMNEIKNEPVEPANKIAVQTSFLAKVTSIHIAMTQQGGASGPIVSYSGAFVGVLLPFIERLFPVIISLAAILGSFLCISFMNRCGRKELLVKSQFVLGALLILLTICLVQYDFEHNQNNSFFLKILICSFFIAIRLTSCSTAGPIGSIYISETVQPSFMPFAIMVNWMGGALLNIAFPILNHALGDDPSYIFLGFGVYCIFGGVVDSMLLIETKGKKEHEINSEIEEKWRLFKGE